MDTKASPKPLSSKQRLFVAEYLKDRNATQAYIRAGYAKKDADVSGPRMLGNAGIKAAIEAGEKKVQEKCTVDAAWIRAALQEVVERSLKRKPVMEFDYENKELKQVTESHKDPETNEWVEHGVWEFDSAGANGALRTLAQIEGIIINKNTHSGPKGEPLIPEQKPLYDLSKYSLTDLLKLAKAISPAIVIPKSEDPKANGVAP